MTGLELKINMVNGIWDIMESKILVPYIEFVMKDSEKVRVNKKNILRIQIH